MPHTKFRNPRTTPFGTKVEFTPQHIIVVGEEGVSEFEGLYVIALVSDGRSQNFISRTVPSDRNQVMVIFHVFRVLVTEGK
jgi:hypothetical protein